MGDRPSLGQLYDQSRHPDLPELPGSLGQQFLAWERSSTLGEQYSAWLDEPAGTPRPARGVDTGAAVGLRARTGSWLRRAPQPAEREATTPAPPATPAPPVERTPHRAPAPRTPAGRIPADPVPTAPVPATPDAAGLSEPAAQPAAETGSGAGSGIGRSSALMAAGTLVSKVLGFARLALLAAVLGTTSRATNVFDTANTLPNMIYLLLAGGVINAIFVPQITRSLRHSDGGKSYTDRLLTLSMSILLVVTLLMTAASPWIYRLFDPEATGARLHLGVMFSLICLPQIFFYGVYTLFGEVLNARGRFGAFMWSPVLANLVMIAGLLVMLVSYPRNVPPEQWTPTMIWLLAGSATLGIVAQALVLIWPLKRAGYTWHPDFRVRGVGLRATSKIAGWAFGAVVVQQIGLLVTSRVLNAVPDNYGGKFAQSVAYILFMLPHGIVTVSLVTALYTRMSNAAAAGDDGAVAHDLRTGFRLSGLASIAASIGSIALTLPFVGVFFPAGQGGRFAIGATTIAMMIGLVPFAVCVLQQRAFFAYEDARTPFLIQGIGTVVTIVGALAASTLPPRWVGPGVALTQTFSYVAQAIAGVFWLRRLVGPMGLSDVARTYARLAIAGLFATAGALIVGLAVGLLGSGRIADLITLLLGGGLFAVIYVTVARRLRVDEIDQLIGSVTARIPGLAGR